MDMTTIEPKTICWVMDGDEHPLRDVLGHRRTVETVERIKHPPYRRWVCAEEGREVVLYESSLRAIPRTSA